MWEYEKSKTFILTDVNLVKMDLLNHIFTRKGDRVMMSSFGTSIPDLVFEPLDETLLDLIEEELRAVFDYDPRVEVLEFNIDPQYDLNAVFVTAKLLYIELNTTADFTLNLDFEA